MGLNLLKLFRDLLPTQPTTVGEVISGTFPYYDVELIEGGVQRVYTMVAYSPGDKVYVQDGKITGEAPTLTDYVIDL